jgi:hypothetical protein
MTHDVSAHIHESDPPDDGKGRPWTEQELAELRRMKAAGYRSIAISISLGRTKSAVDEKWRWVNQTEEQCQRRRARINLSRKSNYIASPPRAVTYASISRPSQQMIAERDRRLAVPRSITAVFFGDPAPGYSALDQRL